MINHEHIPAVLRKLTNSSKCLGTFFIHRLPHTLKPSTGSRATAMCLLPQQPLFDHVQVRGQTVSANYGLGIRKRKQVEVVLPFLSKF